MENKRYKLKSGNILEVIQDESPESPDMWDNKDIFLVYDHKQFTVKREGFEPVNIYRYLKINNTVVIENNDQWQDDTYNNYFIFVVYAYIHSGISLSLGNSTYPFNDKWDVSTTGYILVKKDSIEEYNQPTVDGNLVGQKAKECAEGLIETWNQYLSGDVYGYRVLKKRNVKEELTENLRNAFLQQNINIPKKVIRESLDEKLISELQSYVEYEEIDSCWDFYGNNPKTNGMLEHINDEIIEE
tara:strand:+ start:246 stop:974 length:729 start_codon:yes stop_codon:yes gene_type:complete